MSKEQKFGSCFFGGFKKDDVIDYINELLAEHEEEIEEIEKQNKVLNSNLNKELDEKRLLCLRYQKEIEKINTELSSKKTEVENLIEEKKNILKDKDEKIEMLEEEIKQLKIGVQNSEQENSHFEFDIKKAEYIARERVNQIIRKGKIKAEKEYKEKIFELEKEREKVKKATEEVRKAAHEESVKILNKLAARLYSENAKVKEESEKYVELKENEAKKIVKSAKLIADRILKDSAKIISQAIYDEFTQNKNGHKTKLKDFKICDGYDIKKLNREVDEEILQAIKTLKGLEFLNDEKDGKPKENTFKRHRRNFFNEF